MILYIETMSLKQVKKNGAEQTAVSLGSMNYYYTEGEEWREVGCEGWRLELRVERRGLEMVIERD